MTGKNPFFSLTGPKMKKVDIFAGNKFFNFRQYVEIKNFNLIKNEIKLERCLDFYMETVISSA